MRAVVVYESMFGNTRVIASNIADGLRATHEVYLAPVGHASKELLDAADLLVAGGPTHMHRMSSAASRKIAVKAAAKPGAGLALDPDAGEAGLREWFGRMGPGHGLAAAFDTRLTGAPVATGRASRTIARLLRQHGYRLMDAPESFLVSNKNTLLDGEAARARSWGAALGAAASRLDQPARA